MDVALDLYLVIKKGNHFFISVCICLYTVCRVCVSASLVGFLTLDFEPIFRMNRKTK